VQLRARSIRVDLELPDYNESKYINSLGFIKFLKRYKRNVPSVMARPEIMSSNIYMHAKYEHLSASIFLTSASM
jgi:hypothetical protein